MESEPDPSAERAGMSSHFRDLAASQGTRGPIGAIVAALSTEDLSPAKYDHICREYGVRKEVWFRRQVLDLVLGYVRRELENGGLSAKVQRDVRELRLFLQIADGEFMQHRAAEVSSVLREQFEQILADFVIDDAEELQQVELQAAFGLSYDDYLALIRIPLEHAVAELSRLRTHGTEAERTSASAKLSALDPMFRLVATRVRTMGALY